MTTSIAQMQQMINEMQSFNGAYYSAGNALNQVITVGTQLYNDPLYAQAFPASWAAYQAYLISLKVYIDTFIAGLPAIPPLNG